MSNFVIVVYIPFTPFISVSKMMNQEKLFRMPFSSVYPHYVNKAERKWYSKENVDMLIMRLTWYSQIELQNQIEKKVDFETFFDQAPCLNPNASKITGVICWYRIEEIENQLMRNIRYLDKLIDELAKWRKMEKIMRS